MELPETLADLPILFFETPRDFEAWLAAHFAQPTGIWMKLAKKGSGITSISYAEAMDVVLCWGWIDGQVKAYSEAFYLQKFTPRRPKSTWSKVNVAKVERLTAAGKMQPSGLAAVEAAQQDGRWQQAYDSPSNMTVPDDFQAALDKSPLAKTFFATLNKTNRYAFLWRIQTARTPEMRRARIEKLIALLNEGKQFHP